MKQYTINGCKDCNKLPNLSSGGKDYLEKMVGCTQCQKYVCLRTKSSDKLINMWNIINDGAKQYKIIDPRNE